MTAYIGTVELRGGLHVLADVVVLAIALEAKGVTLTAKDGVLLAAPASALTKDDTQQIRSWKRHLLAIAAYDADSSGPESSTSAVSYAARG